MTRGLKLTLLAAAAVLLALVLPSSAHDVAGSDAQSPVLMHGETYTDTAHAVGMITYHCHIHPHMMGMLQVLPAADPAVPATHRIALRDDGNATDLAAMRFEDAAGGNMTTVHLGDTLVWINEGTLSHDVHIVWSAAAPTDTGSFEVWVAVGLVVALTAIAVVARRV